MIAGDDSAEPAQHFGGRLPRNRVAPLGSDGSNRFKNEPALGNLRMRKNEGPAGPASAGVANQPVIVEQIEIERTWTPAHRAFPAGFAFDRMQPAHQCRRRQMGFDPRHAVNEVRLIEAAEWRGSDEGGNGHQLNTVAAKHRKRALDRLARASPRPRNIRTDADKNHVWA